MRLFARASGGGSVWTRTRACTHAYLRVVPQHVCGPIVDLLGLDLGLTHDEPRLQQPRDRRPYGRARVGGVPVDARGKLCVAHPAGGHVGVDHVAGGAEAHVRAPVLLVGARRDERGRNGHVEREAAALGRAVAPAARLVDAHTVLVHGRRRQVAGLLEVEVDMLGAGTHVRVPSVPGRHRRALPEGEPRRGVLVGAGSATGILDAEAAALELGRAPAAPRRDRLARLPQRPPLAAQKAWLHRVPRGRHTRLRPARERHRRKRAALDVRDVLRVVHRHYPTPAAARERHPRSTAGRVGSDAVWLVPAQRETDAQWLGVAEAVRIRKRASLLVQRHVLRCVGRGVLVAAEVLQEARIERVRVRCRRLLDIRHPVAGERGIGVSVEANVVQLVVLHVQHRDGEAATAHLQRAPLCGLVHKHVARVDRRRDGVDEEAGDGLEGGSHASGADQAGACRGVRAFTSEHATTSGGGTTGHGRKARCPTGTGRHMSPGRW
eukprot:5311204-Prymnesium_polylepis.1